MSNFLACSTLVIIHDLWAHDWLVRVTLIRPHYSDFGRFGPMCNTIRPIIQNLNCVLPSDRHFSSMSNIQYQIDTISICKNIWRYDKPCRFRWSVNYVRFQDILKCLFNYISIGVIQFMQHELIFMIFLVFWETNSLIFTNSTVLQSSPAPVNIYL